MDVTFEQMQSRKLTVEPVDLSHWFGTGARCFVREVSATEHIVAIGTIADMDEGQANDFFFRLCLSDEDGARLLKDDTPIDHDKLGAALFRKIVHHAVDMNGFSDGDAEKNSESRDDEQRSG